MHVSLDWFVNMMLYNTFKISNFKIGKIFSSVDVIMQFTFKKASNHALMEVDLLKPHSKQILHSAWMQAMQFDPLQMCLCFIFMVWTTDIV